MRDAACAALEGHVQVKSQMPAQRRGRRRHRRYKRVAVLGNTCLMSAAATRWLSRYRRPPRCSTYAAIAIARKVQRQQRAGEPYIRKRYAQDARSAGVVKRYH